MRVLLADDHALFREGLVSLLRTRDIEVVGQASDGAEAVALARALTPDAILMDLTMPGMGGLEATRAIKAELPDIKVVILTVSEADEDLFEAIRSGAHGYLVKSTPANDFFELLEALDRGEAPLSRGLAGKIVQVPGVGRRRRRRRVDPSRGRGPSGSSPRGARTTTSRPSSRYRSPRSSSTCRTSSTSCTSRTVPRWSRYAHRHGLTQEPTSPPEDPPAADP